MRLIYVYYDQDKKIKCNFESNQSLVYVLQQIKSNIYYNVIEEKGVFFLWFSLSDTPVYMDTLYHNHIHDENIDCGTIGKKDTTKRQKKSLN